MLELMVAVIIIGTLTAIGYPNYIKAKLNTQRNDAHASLVATFNKIERYRTERNLSKSELVTAINDSGDFDNYLAANASATLSSKGYYRITISASGSAYTINATATYDGGPLNQCENADYAKQLQCRDTVCRTLSLDQDGVKSSINSSGATANAASTTCW